MVEIPPTTESHMSKTELVGFAALSIFVIFVVIYLLVTGLSDSASPESRIDVENLSEISSFESERYGVTIDVQRRYKIDEVNYGNQITFTSQPNDPTGFSELIVLKNAPDDLIDSQRGSNPVREERSVVVDGHTGQSVVYTGDAPKIQEFILVKKGDENIGIILVADNDEGLSLLRNMLETITL